MEHGAGNSNVMGLIPREHTDTMYRLNGRLVQKANKNTQTIFLAYSTVQNVGNSKLFGPT